MMHSLQTVSIRFNISDTIAMGNRVIRQIQEIHSFVFIGRERALRKRF